MKTGDSKHALICNDKGQLLADGVVMKKDGDNYRSYFLAPVLQFYVESSGLNVKGNYDHDEYFFQIDGPKSLEILEKACQCDLHDIKFARNKTVTICGTKMTVHRLGMSGALAYEVHGDAKDAETAYTRIREILEKFGGKPLGMRNYCVLNHTAAGYPNQYIHYQFAIMSGGTGLVEFAKENPLMFLPLSGSAADDPEAFYVTPYDIGWGYLVNFDHDFMGKEALMKIKQNPPRKCVTLEWNPEDVGEVFMSQFRGKDVEPYDPIEYVNVGDGLYSGLSGDYVLADGKKIGIATGRTYAFYEQRMISLAVINKEYAQEGKELKILWGNPGHPQKEIRAVVTRFPYYNGEFRNETFDTEKIPHPIF
jgi:glycine cleavage system aminomethyltransferase T